MTQEEKKPSFFVSPERIQDMTDGVFAFAMTLLIVGIEFPNPGVKISESQLTQNILAMAPTFYKFILSFFLIAVFWIVHHKQFSFIKKSNEGLLWINIFLLLAIVFIPFTTDLMDDYFYLKTGMFLFNINILAIGLIYYYQWNYAIKHNLVDERLTPADKKYGLRRNSVTWIVALIALLVGLYKAEISSYLYLIIPIAISLVSRTQSSNKNSLYK